MKIFVTLLVVMVFIGIGLAMDNVDKRNSKVEFESDTGGELGEYIERSTGHFYNKHSQEITFTYDWVTHKIKIKYGKCDDLGLVHAWESHQVSSEICSNCKLVKVRRIKLKSNTYYWLELTEKEAREMRRK